MMPVEGERFTFVADDGHRLVGTWFEGEAAESVAVIAPAMAVPASFYRFFAHWLAENGVATMTFDYRGYGAGRDRPLRQVRADAFRWLCDARDAGVEVVARAGRRPVTWVGHSLGAQAFGLTEAGGFAQAVFFAGANGALVHNAPRTARWAPVLWKVIMPVTTGVLGWFTGRRLGILGDLPAPVIRQWARWCNHPDYLFSEFGELGETYARLRTPIRALYATDDELVSARGFTDLAGRYGNATPVALDPTEHGLRRIGHTGYFRRGNQALWQTTVGDLLIRPPARGAGDPKRPARPARD